MGDRFLADRLNETEDGNRPYIHVAAGCVVIRENVMTFQVTRSESFGYIQDKLLEES